MRRRAGIIGLAAMALLLVLGGALLLRYGLPLGLSRSRLTSVLRAEGAAAFIWMRGAGLPFMCGVSGVIFGWLAGSARVRARLRQRSLLLIDMRAPDMPFIEGVRHVGSRIGDRHGELQDTAAVQLLIDAAQSGKLSVWRRTPSDLIRRLSSRQLRKIASQGAVSQSATMQSAALARLSLARNEVEALWPIHRTIEGRARSSLLGE